MPFLKGWDSNKNKWVIIGSEVVNAFSTVKVNNTNIVADTPADILEILDGNHISITPTESTDSMTISVIANSTNVASTVVNRDASGNFSAGTITAALNGNASTATKLATARTLSLSNDVTGSATFDGSGNMDIVATVVDNSHNHISANVTDATSANTANMIVKRDASGNFSAGTVTATNLSITGQTTSSKMSKVKYDFVTWLGEVAFANTANQKVDIYMPFQFYGEFEIEIVAGWNGQNAAGNLVKKFSVVCQPPTTTGVINYQRAVYSEAEPLTAATFAISDMKYDSTNQRYYITIANQISFSNNIQIYAKGSPATSAIPTDFSTATLSAIYTTDTTVFPTPVMVLPTGVTVDGNKLWHSGNDGAGSGLDADLLNNMPPKSTNTISSIVARDASGNFAAGTITAALSGNATTATTLATARTISYSGDVTGSGSFNGGSDITISMTVADNSHNHISANITDATSSNTANMIVKRDASGNFSAGTITGNLSGYLNVVHGNEAVLVNGYAGGPIWLNYRGTTAAITEVKIGDGLGAGGLTQVTASQFNGPLVGNSSTATKLATTRNISLAGDVTGTGTFDGSGDLSITATVVDDSHYHSIVKVTDNRIIKPNNASKAYNSHFFVSKAGLNAGTASSGDYHDLFVLNGYGDVSGGKVNALAFDKQTMGIYLYQALQTDTVWGTPKQLAFTDSNVATATKLATTRTVSLAGDVTGSGTFDGSGDLSITATVVDDSHNHTTKTTRINLFGQLQTASYRRSVIALCDLTNTNISANSFSAGKIFLHRNNGLTGMTVADVAVEKLYNSTNMNYSLVVTGNAVGSTIRPCTFTYGGVKYGGLELFISDAEYNYIEFNGATNFGIFGVDYYNTQTSTAIIGEISSSLNTTEPVAVGSMYVNKNMVWNTANLTNLNQLTNGPGYITSAASISGNSDTATKLATARTISLTGDVSGSASFDGSANISITATVADDSHTHSEVGIKIDNYKDSTALPSTYPIGTTTFFSNNPTNKFNGVAYCTIVTVKSYNNMACVQYLYPYNVDAPIAYRYAIYSSDTWLPWRNISIEGHTHNYLPLTGGTLTGGLSITSGGNAGLELGRIDGASSTPFVDFHSGATATDYDVRMIASGGNGTAGSGTLNIIAGALTFNGVNLFNTTSLLNNGRTLQANINDLQYASMYRTAKDANDIYTSVEYKDASAKTIVKSVLSGGTSPAYTTRTETWYQADGVTVAITKVYTLTYDAKGNVSSQVMA
jgi:hypothetical protein